MFIDYTKPTGELVADLINRDNPDLPFPIKADECFFGIPIVWSAAGNFRNTELNITPRSNSPYIGGFKVRYRRLDVSKLFPEGVWFDDWYTDVRIPTDEYLAALERRTGMKLVRVKDVTMATTHQVYGLTGTSNGVAMAGACLAFFGTLTNKYSTRYPVELHAPDVNKALVHWDGVPRNETDALRRYTTYGHDFSAFSDYLETWSTSTPKTLGPTDMDLLNLIQYIADITGQPFDLGPDTTPCGLNGAFGLRTLLPAATPVGNNGADFNRVVIIYRASKLTNIPDALFLHYKV